MIFIADHLSGMRIIINQQKRLLISQQLLLFSIRFNIVLSVFEGSCPSHFSICSMTACVTPVKENPPS